ncbi:hypothetical protein [Pedobacter aquatilis]|uniref:toxin-antitoxin system YwqK family antitoxin n=1 Tax=Pedobacter aquatilis TaxID=351343 RepID=UPI00292EFE92|nr:hypothetical protein [Pedobacter aquatilis]
MKESEKKYFDNGQLEFEYEIFNGIKHGKFIRYFEDGEIEMIGNFIDGRHAGLWTEYYENGQIAETGEYINDEYCVDNFWTENGEQLLINGTGKTIRKFGATQGDVYEQYFLNGKFTGEKKIEGVGYMMFKPKED